MSALYPSDADIMKRYAAGEDLVAAELNTAFDAILAVETELGVNPSGDYATISDRIFARGNIDRTSGDWSALEWSKITVANSSDFTYLGPGHRFTWTENTFKSVETEFGAGIPGFFAQYQIPIGASTAEYDGRPWVLHGIHHEEGNLDLVGMDARMNDLNTSNTKTGTETGIIFWGLFT